MKRAGWITGLLLALGVAGVLSPWASSAPDGLERVAQRLGFARRAAARPAPAAPMAEYRVPAVPNERASTAVAGLAGTLVVFVVVGGLGHVLRRKGSPFGEHGARSTGVPARIEGDGLPPSGRGSAAGTGTGQG